MVQVASERGQAVFLDSCCCLAKYHRGAFAKYEGHLASHIFKRRLVEDLEGRQGIDAWE
jgi:hypothetical protein